MGFVQKEERWHQYAYTIDLETQIPTFFYITPARSHDTKAMDVIPYEDNNVMGYVRKCSIYEMLQIVSISLTDITTLRDLFTKPNYNIVNELDGSTEPSLF